MKDPQKEEIKDYSSCNDVHFHESDNKQDFLVQLGVLPPAFLEYLQDFQALEGQLGCPSTSEIVIRNKFSV